MCGNLKNASTQEMVAFIEGRTLSRTSSRDEGEEDSFPKILAQARPQTTVVQPQQQQPPILNSNTANRPPQTKNPYGASSSGTAAATTKVTNPYSVKPANNPYAQKSKVVVPALLAATAALPVDEWQEQSSKNHHTAPTPNQAPAAPNKQTVFQDSLVRPPTSVTMPPVQQQQQQQHQQKQQQQPAVQQFSTARIQPSTGQTLLLPTLPKHIAQQQRPSSNNRRQDNDNKGNNSKKLNPFVRAAHRPQVYQTGPVPLDAELSKNWIYPVHPNYPVRDYQLEITETAIQYNTLVSLPTGLGKTLIAAVVLYNYYRWFPVGGKVVFLAPTLPLVDQQVRACYQIMGIPAQHTAVLNGKVSAATRVQLWKERRVFFCTPQTVEKDMEAGRCPAKQVVCLVLDEAHKATGNFAYTKVVELCEEAGAHLRILGLSATPGAKVQQVQKVIDALRITRLEARSEEEVKQYIHERHNEIVVVKKRSLCHAIELQLNALIAPIMNKLRANTNIRQRIGPNDCTLTSFCIHRGRQHHHDTTGDHRHDGFFIAAQKLIDARANLFSHGIGSVRGKLLELKNNPQRGVLSTIIKGKEFQAVVDAVITASSGKHSQETTEDKKGNNPKLAKLDEILREHFLRAEALKSTTRAIVFSQWRDSVSEIVDVLSLSRPAIRPRYFVGQSSGSGNKPGAMKGMPQKVQQEAIREFQEGVFNVLVCTCIGEEGLDIGEVDLIVNYDTLRSPIRMIQRVGRTGRKRDGRVVCLVSEGQEQKDMAKSKNNERSLQRALRKPDNFKLRPNRIMFPQPPALLKKDMIVTGKLQLSQVGGHAEPAERKKKEAEIVVSWKLSDQKENIRFQTFGPIQGIKSSTKAFPILAKRKLLRARMRSYTNISDSRRFSQKAVAGASRRLLMTVEAITEDKQDSTKKFRGLSDRDSAGIFPLEDSNCRETNTIVEVNWAERLPLKANASKEATDLLPLIQSPQLKQPPIGKVSNVTRINPYAPRATSENKATDVDRPIPSPIRVALETGRSLIHKARGNASILQIPLDEARPGSVVDEALAFGKTNIEDDTRQSLAVAESSRDKGKRQLPPAAGFKLPTPPASSSESEEGGSDDEEEMVEETRPIEMIVMEVECAVATVPLKLPTPPASSSESEPSDDEEEEVTKKTTTTKVIPDVLKAPGVFVDSVKLPTPPASSSESEGEENEDGEHGMRQETIPIELIAQIKRRIAIESAVEVSHPSTSTNKKPGGDAKKKLDKGDEYGHLSPSKGSNGPKVEPVEGVMAVVSTRKKPTGFKNALEILQSSGEKKDTRVDERQGFRLPTQDSSSDEGSASSDQGDDDEVSVDAEEATGVAVEESTAYVSDKHGVKESCTDTSTANESSKEAAMIPSMEHNFIYESEGVASQMLSSAAVPENILMAEVDDAVIPRDCSQDRDGGIIDTPSPHKNQKERQSRSKLQHLEGPKSESPMNENLSNAAFPYQASNDEFEGNDESPEALHKTSRPRTWNNVILTQHIDATPVVARHLSAKGDELTDTPTEHPVESNSQGILVDTPASSKALAGSNCAVDLVDTPQSKLCHEAQLSETQDSCADDIFCLICGCGDANDDLDPIVLCDGVKGDDCSFAAHSSCYSLEPSTLNLMDEWRCDVCEKKRLTKSIRFVEPSCFVCQQSRGALKLSLGSPKTWFHPYCMTWADGDAVTICGVCLFPGATTCSFKTCSRAAHPHCVRERVEKKCWLTVIETQRKKNVIFCPMHQNEESTKLRWKHEDGEAQRPMCFVLPSSRVTRLKVPVKRELSFSKHFQPNKRLKAKAHFEDDTADSIVDDSPAIKNDKRKRVRKNLAKRHRGMFNSAFIDAEAGVDSDDDIGGDAEEASQLRQIDEDEELAALGWINDSSQLGYTQDDLDRIEPESPEEEPGTIHRMVDAENERKRQFATPIFNRRMRRGADSQGSDAWAGSPNSSYRSSLKGLGNCNFIRSVIEHARKGGDVEEVEAAFNEIAEEVAQEEEQEEDVAQPVTAQGHLVVEYIPSDTDSDEEPPPASNGGDLTAEQKAVIERKRLDALARLKRKD
jgi:ERCC4-related helicase